MYVGFFSFLPSRTEQEITTIFSLTFAHNFRLRNVATYLISFFIHWEVNKLIIPNTVKYKKNGNTPRYPTSTSISSNNQSQSFTSKLSLQKLIKSVLIIYKDPGTGFYLMCSKRLSTKCVVTEYWQITKKDLDNPKNGSDSKHWGSVVGVPLEEWADKNGSRVGTEIQRQACTPGWHFYLDGWG